MKKGWQTKTLGDVCDFEGGSQPPKSEFIYDEKPGYVRFLQIRDFGSDKNITYIRHSKKNRLCDENDILIGRYGASVGKILTGKSGAYNVALMKTIPNLEVLDQSWFYHFLVSDEFQTPLLNVADRSAQAGFSKDDIYNFPVPVPPLAEQQRIVGLLDEAFEGLATAKANAEENLQNARTLFESHLQSVFTQRGPGWVEKSLEELGTITSSKRIFKSEYVESGVPFYRTKEIKQLANGRDITTELFISEARYNEIKERFGVPKEGDILLTAIGTIGEIWVVEGDNDFYFKDGNVLWLNEFTSINPGFLRYVLVSFVESLNKMAHGSAYSALPIQRLNAHRIFLPSKAEQEEIVATLDALTDETQRLAHLYERKLSALEALKKSLLHQAFTGEL
jgi:type I restriction enzyme S subunit